VGTLEAWFGCFPIFDSSSEAVASSVFFIARSSNQKRTRLTYRPSRTQLYGLPHVLQAYAPSLLN
jgi:hypothetical protein